MLEPALNQTASPAPYRGRFAPTPSGPLHLGSLLTALAGWLEARTQHGRWLLRIDDLDTPRCPPGAESLIRQQLETHGLFWDETPRYQSRHVDEYNAALHTLQHRGLLYACTCTRAELASRSRPGPDGPVYDGHCRQCAHLQGALRLRVDDTQTLEINDRWLGLQQRQLGRDIGDFVVRRSDGQIGYQLACVVDEAAQGINAVVRGADLLGSSFRQLALQQVLALPHPGYGHLPLLTDADGRKLSKQNHAEALNPQQAGRNLWRCLQWLGQRPDVALAEAPAATVLAWALAHWQPARINTQAIAVVE